MEILTTILMTNQLSFLGADCVQNNGSTTILTGPWLLYAIKLYSITVAIGDQTNVFMCSFSETDLSHHANLRMRVSTVQNGRFREGFRRWIHDEFVVVFLSKVSSYIYFYRKFSLVRPDDWWVNFTRPRAVLTRLGRPDEWLVRTLIKLIYKFVPDMTIDKISFGSVNGLLTICHQGIC